MGACLLKGGGPTGESMATAFLKSPFDFNIGAPVLILSDGEKFELFAGEGKCSRGPENDDLGVSSIG